MALYFNVLVMKLFNNSRKLFQAEIIVKLKASLLLNVSLCIHLLTILTEALHLSGSPSVASTASP